MNDISIYGTLCLLAAVVIAARVVIWQRAQIARLKSDIADYQAAYFDACDRLTCFVDAEAKRHAQRMAALAKARVVNAQRALERKWAKGSAQ